MTLCMVTILIFLSIMNSLNLYGAGNPDVSNNTRIFIRYDCSLPLYNLYKTINFSTIFTFHWSMQIIEYSNNFAWGKCLDNCVITTITICLVTHIVFRNSNKEVFWYCLPCLFLYECLLSICTRNCIIRYSHPKFISWSIQLENNM